MISPPTAFIDSNSSHRVGQRSLGFQTGEGQRRHLKISSPQTTKDVDVISLVHQDVDAQDPSRRASPPPQ